MSATACPDCGLPLERSPLEPTSACPRTGSEWCLRSQLATATAALAAERAAREIAEADAVQLKAVLLRIAEHSGACGTTFGPPFKCDCADDAREVAARTLAAHAAGHSIGHGRRLSDRAGDSVSDSRRRA